MTESQWLAERNNLQAQVDALEAARLQYRASMERFQRLGRACLHWQAGGWSHELDAAINEWKAGEPKDAKEAT